MMALLEYCATSLTTLDISFCRNIAEDALGVLADGTENLRSVVLWGCTQVRSSCIHFVDYYDSFLTRCNADCGVCIRRSPLASLLAILKTS